MPQLFALLIGTLVAAHVAAEGKPTDWPYCCVADLSIGSAGGSATLVGISGTRGIAITGWHVVEDGGTPELTFPSGYRCRGRVVGADRKHDLAAIEIPVVAGMTTARRVRRATAADATFLAVGYPYYGRNAAHWTSGKYLGYSGTDVQFSASPYLHSGFSGGALFAPNGDYVGVTNGYGEGYSYAVSGPVLEQFVARFMGATK